MFMGGKKRKGKQLLARLMLAIVFVTMVLQQGTLTSFAAENTQLEELVTGNESQDFENVDETGIFDINSQIGEEAESYETESEKIEENVTLSGTVTSGNGDEVITDVTPANEEVAENGEVTETEETTADDAAEAESSGDEEFTTLSVNLADDEAPDTVKILMVGNSLTRYNDVAGKLTALYALDGVTAQVDTRTQMGASLFDQADILKDSTREAIVNGGYDFVILQEKSSGFSEALLRQGAEAFYPWIQEAPSQPQLVFYMPWANEDVLKSMQTTVTDAYVSVAKDFNAKLAPAGEAYYELYFDKNKKWYRKGDNVHGNDLASLISASTIYYTLTGKEEAFSFTSEDIDALKALVESADYKNNRVSYNAETVNLIEATSLKYTGIYKDLTNVPSLEGRGMDSNTNLAKGKQGSASSNGRGSTRGIGARNVGNLTDGSYTSFLVSHEEDPDIWYAVDFGTSTKLDEVILYFGGTGTYVNTEHAVFTVEMSDSYDSGYRVVASGESTSTEPLDIKFDETEGRYLRVHVSSFSGPYVSMFEIEAYYQRPEQTEEPGESEIPENTDEPAEPENPAPSNDEHSEEEENVTVKAFPGDFLQVKAGDQVANMALYDGNMYEAILPLNSGDNTISIIVNGNVVKERQCTVSGSSKNVIVRYFADKDKIVTGFDSHKDANGNVVQDIKKTAHWTGNFFNRTGINEFKEFGGWDQANTPSCLDYIGGGVFKRTYTYTVPENSVSYEFKINFDGAWSNGEVPSSNATVTFPATDKETDTFVLFVNSITGEWFDSINKGKVTYKLADGSTYDQEAGKANVTVSFGEDRKEMVQTSLKKYRFTDYLPAGEHNVSIYVDDQLLQTTVLSLNGASSVTAVYDTAKGLELIKKDVPATEDKDTDEDTESGNDNENENPGEQGTIPENENQNQDDSAVIPENGNASQNDSNSNQSGSEGTPGNGNTNQNGSTGRTEGGNASQTVPEVKTQTGNAPQNESVSKSEVTEVVQVQNVEESTKETIDEKQKKASVSEISAGKKSFTVKFKKSKTKVKGINGYEIQYSTDKKFENGTKSVFVKKSKTSKKISKLKANKKYYVRVRTYKESGDLKIYSNWGKTKIVKTKK